MSTFCVTSTEIRERQFEVIFTEETQSPGNWKTHGPVHTERTLVCGRCVFRTLGASCEISVI